MSNPRNPNDKKNSSTKDAMRQFTSISKNARVIPLKTGASQISSADLAKQYTQNRTPTNEQAHVTKSFDSDSPPPMLSGKPVDKPKVDIMAGAPPTLSAHIKERKSQNNATNNNNDDEPGAPPSKPKP